MCSAAVVQRLRKSLIDASGVEVVLEFDGAAELVDASTPPLGLLSSEAMDAGWEEGDSPEGVESLVCCSGAGDEI